MLCVSGYSRAVRSLDGVGVGGEEVQSGGKEKGKTEEGRREKGVGLGRVIRGGGGSGAVVDASGR